MRWLFFWTETKRLRNKIFFQKRTQGGKKSKRWNTKEGRVKKRKAEFRREKWIFLIFFWQKRYGDEKKKGKEEGSQDKWDQAQREKREMS